MLAAVIASSVGCWGERIAAVDSSGQPATMDWSFWGPFVGYAGVAGNVGRSVAWLSEKHLHSVCLKDFVPVQELKSQSASDWDLASDAASQPVYFASLTKATELTAEAGC